jgi:hypothetical protein
MCHEVFIYVEDIIGSTWAFDAPASVVNIADKSPKSR